MIDFECEIGVWLVFVGRRGSIFLRPAVISGIKTGTAVVQAKLKDPRYSEVSPVSATLVVVANLVLDPSVDSYILVHGDIQYKVKQFKQNSVEDIVMPNSQYFLSVGKNFISLLD